MPGGPARPSGQAIACSGVTKRFGAVAALDGLDLSVPAGAVVGYLGPNGAGKSTTLRILVDLARPDAGAVEVLGVDPRQAGPALRRRIGYLPGELRLDERLSVADTLRSWERLRGAGVERRYVDQLCQRLELDPTRQTRGLSSGNRRKVGLVGAFMARPEVLILDEPTSGVDPLVQEAFLHLVAEARAEGRTVFLSSHVLSEVQRIADHVVVLRSGRVVATGSVDDLRRQARQPFTAWFSGEPPTEAVAAVPGASEVEARGQELVGFVSGPPGPLLSVLVQHGVEHLMLPEPDLEEAFLRFYTDAAEPAGAPPAVGGRAVDG